MITNCPNLSGSRPTQGSRQVPRQAGAATVALILTFSILIVGFAVLYTTRLGATGAQASSLQDAADAAALAGAQQIVSDAPGQVVASIQSGNPWSGGLGQLAASEFASRNGATLVHYQYFPGSDRIEVTVRSNAVLETGSREEARATARLGINIGPCSIPPAPTPTPVPTFSPSPGASPTPTPSPTPTSYTTNATCGGLIVPVRMTPGTGVPLLLISAADIKAHFTPALAE